MKLSIIAYFRMNDCYAYTHELHLKKGEEQEDYNFIICKVRCFTVHFTDPNQETNGHNNVHKTKNQQEIGFV